MSKFIISGFYDEIDVVKGDLNKQIALIKEFNENYLCPRIINGKNIADYSFDEFLKDIKPILEKNNIKFSSIGSPIGKIYLKDEAGYNKQLEKLRVLLKICKEMNCKYIRIFSFFMEKDVDIDNCFNAVLEKLKGFLKVVEEENSDVVLIHENEKDIFGDKAERCVKLYKELNHPNFKLCYDASNYIQCGYDPTKSYELVKPYTVYYHIKDCSTYKVEVPLGMGIGNYPYILNDLHKNNYEGFVTMEPHTHRYALTKKLVNFTPFGCLFMRNCYKAFRLIDKNKKISYFKSVSLLTVFKWQYESLKAMLNTATK